MFLVGVVERQYIDFLILLIRTPLVSALFCCSIPTFCSFFKLEERRRRRMPNCDFLFTRCVHKIPLYSDVIRTFDRKSAIEHDGAI